MQLNKEVAFGEYRTRRLVLDAYDRLSGMQVVADPIELRPTKPLEISMPDDAWARAAQSQPGDTGAALAAVLKAMDGPRPIRDVRLMAAFVLEPRLLGPPLPSAKAVEWQRLVGTEANPLTGNVTTFVARNNAAWGTAVRNHRGNGRLIENLDDGTWAPGPGLDAIDTSTWPDGRAGFVLEALKGIEGTAMRSLPDEIQGWITDAAAA